jgi:hypothetical protein
MRYCKVTAWDRGQGEQYAEDPASPLDEALDHVIQVDQNDRRDCRRPHVE